ncbi:acyl-CoA dehydrogenase-like protein [Calycina marina]|uniref:Acyl-CoA dehydrogenase-like protein n=1 Tax=Calycina marina TaxID=1763456 RepID=A0A9P7Z394_9HELO|nr:acyl-CoA dehydrogenase-like protein [Calycina marina]
MAKAFGSIISLTKSSFQLSECGSRSTSPWAEPAWYSVERPSPYYKESHVRLRNYVRKWAEDDPSEWAHYPIAAGIRAAEWDGFHDFIIWDELYRAPSISSAFIGLVVGVPPLKTYASTELQAKILPEILEGRKRICLAITEPSAGSDVRGITTTAELTLDGKHYIVNGEKKWITNGFLSDYFMTLARTGGEGAGGLSMVLIPRLPGIGTRKIEIGAGGMSATTYITFEDEGSGFKYTMSNFNHERLWIAFQALRGSRICLEDVMAWCQKREAFGKTLIEQPVVRHKLGHMARQVDGLQSWIESIVYELDHLSHAKGNASSFDRYMKLKWLGSELLGGVTGLLKVQSGIVGKYVADECQKLMGGLGLTKTGQGARIEAIARSVPTLIVPGGSEDVLLDLGVREAVKLSLKASKSKL